MYIGVDLGTSGIKTLLVNRKGEVIDSISKTYDLIIPLPGWSEQDPNLWFLALMDCLRRLVRGHETEIRGISFSGQMHGLVILDKDDVVLRNAILWNDQRTTKQNDYLNNVIGTDNLLKYTGNISLTGLTAPKVLWVRDNEPEIFAKINKILLPKDYLAYKLSGKFASDVSDLSGTLYFNPKTKQYSQEMLNLLGIKREQLPEIYESYEVIGRLSEKIKKELNIIDDVAVVIGGGDQAVGAVGVGVVGNGEASISLGTSGVINVSSDDFVIDEISYFQSYAHANGRYHIMAVMLNAAGAIKWWNENIIQSQDYERFYRNVSSANPEEDVFFLPYLTGERAPINNPYAKGVLYGLGIHHTEKDIDRAVVEGVTFALKDSFEFFRKLGIKIEQVRITGGGAKSNVWAQMIADVMDVEVVKIQTEEGPALGAAILAMIGCKEFSTVESACHSIIRLSDKFIPNRKSVEFYKNKYSKFSKLYPVIKDLFDRL